MWSAAIPKPAENLHSDDIAPHNAPLRIIGVGLNRFAVVTRGTVRCFPAFLMKFNCDTLEALLAALSYRKGASHDCSSTTDD
jgi:hypothetical protein